MRSDTASPSPTVRRRRPGRRARAVIAVLLALCLSAATVSYACIDRWMLSPAREPIDAAGAARVVLPTPGVGGGSVEAYVVRDGVPPGGEPEVFVLLYPGRGGRAEWAARWAVDDAGGRPVEAWAINYPGVGASPGSPRLADVGPAALAAYDAVKAKAGDRPVVLSGPSFGAAAALYVAARRPVAGLVLSNPPPVRRMILRRYGWWNLWVLAGPAALGVPADLDTPANAARTRRPAVFVTSGADTVVPAEYQQTVIDAFAGPARRVVVPGATHHVRLAGNAAAARHEAVEWLWGQVGR